MPGASLSNSVLAAGRAARESPSRPPDAADVCPIRHFSNAVSDQNRNQFAQAIVALYHRFDLDGIDM